MRSRTNNGFDEVRLMSRQEAARYCGLGVATVRAWCDEIGATWQIGSRVLFDRVAIDKAIDAMARDNI